MKQIPTTQMQQLIEKTALSVVDQLMPRVVCYECSGSFSKKLLRELTWLEVMASSQELVDLEYGVIRVIVGTAKEVLSEAQKNRISGLCIFCIVDDENLEIQAYSNSLAVKLANPTVEDVLFHVKAMLLVSESLQYYDRKYPIYGQNKQTILQLIDHIYKRETVCVIVDSLASADVWYDFLFEGLPVRLKPKKGMSRPSNRPQDYSFITSESVIDLILSDSNCLLFTASYTEQLAVPIIDLRQHSLDPFNECIKHYLAAILASLSLPDISYYWGNHKELTFKDLSETLLNDASSRNVRAKTPKELNDFFELNNTLSLPNIIEEFEYQVLSRLKERTEKVKGTVLASGIREGTLHKKMERHHSKRSDGKDS